MIDELSIVETDKVIHTVETDMVKLVVEIECFGMSFDDFDKETGSSDGLKPKQADLNCVHALNEPHFHEIFCCSQGEVNPVHAYYNGSRTSKDNEDPCWSTSFKIRRTQKTSSALKVL
ncbi:hypothetical protein Tco_0226024 [Tanacetum coccineum]